MKDKIAMVSTFYPNTGGVATYTKYLADELWKLDNSILFLAKKLEKSVKESKNIIRCWDTKPYFFLQIFREVIRRRIKIVHIQQEMNLFGGVLNSFFLPLQVIHTNMHF